jgi:simple sugar transport system ATP-binding protein
MNKTGTRLYEARNVAKRYGGVEAVSHADLVLDRSEIVALVGDNGAGKSTLIKVMSGAEIPDAGELILDGHRVSFAGPLGARRLGIETVYQDLALADNLDVAANLFLGRAIRRRPPLGWFGILDHRRMRREARELLEGFGVRGIPVDERLDQLSGGQRQIAAISRAAAWGSSVVILDEPTAALGVRESSRVLDFMRTLKERGTGVIWVSHNMQQVVEVADRAVVMRRGRSIANLDVKESTVERIVNLIVGGADGNDRRAASEPGPP